MNYDLTLFEKGLDQLKIALSDEQKEQFIKYYEYLTEKNKVMNLTAITEYEEVIVKHFLDSLCLVKASCFTQDALKGKTLIDIGTGAGFPGIPLKIAFPDLKVVLLDSLNKRVTFLNEVIDMFDLKDITALHGRAEDYARQKDYRETFDYAVSRAVANLSALTEYCLPYVKPSGYFIPYKSGRLEEELPAASKAIKTLGGTLTETLKFPLLDTDMDRTFCCYKEGKRDAKKVSKESRITGKRANSIEIIIDEK